MKIKNKNDLLKLQRNMEPIIALREGKPTKTDQIDVLVGMATCGIAAGAKETYDELNRIISEQNLSNINIIEVGCLGYCIKEPTIQVCKPGKKPLLYGLITKDKAERFLNEVILNDKELPKYNIEMTFEKVVD